jgi:predicted O-methyltransferase YrrM
VRRAPDRQSAPWDSSPEIRNNHTQPSPPEMSATTSSKVREWFSLTLRNPREALDRVATLVDVRSDRLFVEPPDYSTVSYADVWRRIVDVAEDAEGASVLADYADEAAEVEAVVRERKAIIRDAPIDQIHSADFALARLCYLAARVSRPANVLETGVAYGVTSTFVLSALERNGAGWLHSIDLPPLGRDVDKFVGALIPDHLRHRWRLYRGVTRRVLPELLTQLGRVDMFIHDSLHTYRNIKFELEKVTPRLSPGAIVIADDIDENPAFKEWSQDRELAYSGVVQEERKASLLGVAFMP